MMKAYHLAVCENFFMLEKKPFFDNSQTFADVDLSEGHRHSKGHLSVPLGLFRKDITHWRITSIFME